jgi:hypothetical protein
MESSGAGSVGIRGRSIAGCCRGEEQQDESSHRDGSTAQRVDAWGIARGSSMSQVSASDGSVGWERLGRTSTLIFSAILSENSLDAIDGVDAAAPVLVAYERLGRRAKSQGSITRSP